MQPDLNIKKSGSHYQYENKLKNHTRDQPKNQDALETPRLTFKLDINNFKKDSVELDYKLLLNALNLSSRNQTPDRAKKLSVLLQLSDQKNFKYSYNY